MSLDIRQWLRDRHIEMTELADPRTEVSGIAFHLVQDMELKSLSPFDVCPLTDILELPLTPAWQSIDPIVKLTLMLLRLLHRRKPLRRSEGTWLAFEVAYLLALREVLDQESQLRRPWINRAKVPTGDESDRPLEDPKLQALLKTLRPGRLSDSQAEQALSLMGESLLVQQINKLTIAWFMANGTEETEAKLLTQRLVNGLAGYLLDVVAQNPLPLAQLQKFVRLGRLSHLRHTLALEETVEEKQIPDENVVIDIERESYRSQLIKSLSLPLLGDIFSLKDIYVPLKGIPVEEAYSLEMQQSAEIPPTTPPSEVETPVDLHQWVNEQLEDKTTVTVIEAEGGYGKTSFCQIWAAEVAQTLYPQWMPVVIPLRNATLGQTLEETLESAFPLGRFQDTDGWLSPNSPPCLLILEGLDELPSSGQRSRHLLAFIDQVMRFHAQYLSEERPPRHKIILTSRDRTLEGLTRKYRLGSILPLKTQLRRIVIQPMEQEQWREWFQNWSKLQSVSIAKLFFSLLKQEGLFLKQPTKNAGYLVRQPLMLYLFGILHRDYLLDKSLFNLPLSALKFEIYDRIKRWLLGQAYHTQPLPEVVREGLAHASRSPEAIANLLSGRPAEQLRSQMQETALQILQSGRWRLTLKPDSSGVALFPALFFTMTLAGKEQPWHSAITFSHRSLGEFLAAEEIAQKLKELTLENRDRYGEIHFVIDSPKAVAQHLYFLLSYGVLSPEIEELVIERLQQEQSRNPQLFSFKVLFQRLYSFYLAYCSGRWFDEGIVHQSYSHLQEKGHCFNTLQVDAAVGINVFLLLCITSRYAAIPFFPCGDPNVPQEYDADRLLTFISRVTVLSPTRFSRRVQDSLHHLFFTGACLNRTMLAKVNLAYANLSLAELIGTNLAGANLAFANLSWASLAGANLTSANLEQTNLEGADLSGANLLGVNLNSAYLQNACLYQAKLDQESENFARNHGAIFSLEEFHQYSKSLVPSIHRSHLNLTDQEFLATEKIQIESLAGEPVLPSAWDDTYSNEVLEEVMDETVIYTSEDFASPLEKDEQNNATISLNHHDLELDDYDYEDDSEGTILLE